MSTGWVPIEVDRAGPARFLTERRMVELSQPGVPPATVPVVRLRAGPPRSRALILLSGGPGISCSREWSLGVYDHLIADLVDQLDIIAFDQRGVGGASPVVPPVTRWDLPLSVPGVRDSVLA